MNKDIYSDRINKLISQMTIEEKVSQLTNSAAAISRLGINKYDWWNEALHGVARAGVATVFPQAIDLMPEATFELPYDGAKEVLLVNEVDNRDFLTCLFNKMYDELPEPKNKKTNNSY